ncbi:class I SAM-dependent methyltransferase [Thermobifida fusca]|uniref:Phosphatidylethanolamine N-methyltransferase / phosphatidyl-N-methylethanolamine N-methyltransferase n=1 Tax=Thermobifida fusca (strain YX) TaxID=269800 RepID=Q47RZ4_THEFY|nr:class I SAM-dependent methyltransferase [Thermobifida fusca]AAZ54773.1 phosphatidylethanolamine N-methyltransferase / phosphatidyl-N-methylethanolamine N-methyltransferase [Thermobifida fusca YX]
MNTQISRERQDRAVAHTRQIWDRRAPRYDDGAWLERKILKDTRQRLCAQASGRVLDVAVGTGRNLAHYSADVTEVVGIDLSPGMLSQARTAASRASFPVELHEGDARHLPFSDADFDTVVCFLALCEIPGQAAALNEMRRVLRTGGRLLLLDHVEYTRAPMRWIEPLRARRRGTAPRRRPVDVARDQGFVIDQHHSLAWGFFDGAVAHRPHS